MQRRINVNDTTQGTLDSTAYSPYGIDEGISPDLAEYAHTLRAAGFTVYTSTELQKRHDGTRVPLEFFVYSREVDSVTCYGIVNAPSYATLGEPISHSMPLEPSRLN